MELLTAENVLLNCNTSFEKTKIVPCERYSKQTLTPSQINAIRSPRTGKLTNTSLQR